MRRSRLGAEKSVSNHRQHRELLANQIKRSRYFWLPLAKANLPEETRGQIEVPARFYEGAAARYVMIGQARIVSRFASFLIGRTRLLQSTPIAPKWRTFWLSLLVNRSGSGKPAVGTPRKHSFATTGRIVGNKFLPLPDSSPCRSLSCGRND